MSEIVVDRSYSGENRRIEDIGPPAGHPDLREFDIFSDPAFSPKINKYALSVFSEASDPVSALEAWQVHGRGYHQAGYVSDDALITGFLSGYVMPDCLPASIDKSRGDTTLYYMARKPERYDGRSTLRKFSPGEGESYEGVPAFNLCKDALSKDGKQALEDAQADGYAIKEVAALAIEPFASALGAHELFRKIVTEAMVLPDDTSHQREKWFFSIVCSGKRSAYDWLVKSYGVDTFPVIGEDVSIPGDSRVNPDVRLRPVLVDPDTYIDTILSSALSANEKRISVPLLRRLIFFTDGLTKDQMSKDVYEMRRALLSKENTA